ncbi:hypothetical protein [Methylobacterium haplocladii]|uniref:hypothetical protein n=1 Tax=Methylobacterium haplocladii TaxID=1176176 RepID=UPI0011BEC5EC|nr:hypothetical protein [Methylobacterium haplocladii]GJD85468.1 hypothetical protein HPGCJGGD_3357 [Methylobacterium haplocladii]
MVLGSRELCVEVDEAGGAGGDAVGGRVAGGAPEALVAGQLLLAATDLALDPHRRVGDFAFVGSLDEVEHHLRVVLDTGQPDPDCAAGRAIVLPGDRAQNGDRPFDHLPT